MTAQPPPPPPPTDEAPPPGGPGVAQFFDRIRRYGAVRPDDGRWFAGVAAALARRWGIDPLLVRGGFVILALFGGVGLLLYGLGWLFLPHPDGRIHAQEVLRGVVTPGFVGGVLFVLADLGSSGWGRGGWYGGHPFGGGLVLVALVVLGVWWFAGGRHRGRRDWRSGPGNGGPGNGGPGNGGPGNGGWHGGGWHGGGWQGGGWGGPGTPGPGDPGSGTGSGAAGSPSGGPAPEPGPGPSSEEPGNAGDTGDIPPYGTPPSASGSSWSSSWAPAGVRGDEGYYGTVAPAAVLAPPAPPAPRWAPKPDLNRPSHALTSVALGLALLAAAVVVAVNSVVGGGLHPTVAVAAGVALAILGLGVVAAGLSGRRAGALAPLGILLALVTVAASSTADGVSWAGRRTWTPTTLTGTTSYQLGLGDARLDLRGVSAPGATTASPAEVDVRVGVGNLVVVLPSGVAVRVIGTSAVGGVQNEAGLTTTTNRTTDASPSHSGPRAELDGQTSAFPVVVVHADVGVGNLTIEGPTGQEQ
jgi:phage shock protein PspC (stress-responsive transcriptional regulator)